MATVYISPTGLAKNSGASATKALPITSLDKAIQLAGPSGTVILLSDKGPYTLTGPISLTHGGMTDRPVTIIGADSAGNQANIQINGTRPETFVPGMEPGKDVFRLLDGADNLVFENISFANVGTAFRVGADVQNIVIQDMYADNVQRFFEDGALGSAPTATISGLTVRNVEVHGFSKGVVRVQYDSHDVLVENVFGDSERQDGDPIAMGIHLTDTVHNVIIRKTTMSNAQSSSDTYWNGDGFATERGVYNVIFEDTVARGNADGGYDLKSSATTLVRAVAEGNGRNYRLWDEVTLIDSVGLDPHKWGGTSGQYQIQILENAKVTVIGGYLSDSGSATKVVVGDGGTITFSDTYFIHSEKGVLATGAGIIGIDPEHVSAVMPTGVYSQNGLALWGNNLIGHDDASTPLPGYPVELEAAPAPSDTSADNDSGGSGGKVTAPAPDLAISHEFDIPRGSGTTTIAFDANDTILTNKPIYGSSNGIIQFEPNGLLALEKTKSALGDQMVNIQGATALRYLGESDGNFVYAAAGVRPSGAIEGKLTSETLNATSKSDSFFYDNKLGLELGSDKIKGFSVTDRLVTTEILSDSNNDGLLVADSHNSFNLSSSSSDHNTLRLFDSSGKAIVMLDYDGSTAINGLTYYVYSLHGGDHSLSL